MNCLVQLEPSCLAWTRPAGGPSRGQAHSPGGVRRTREGVPAVFPKGGDAKGVGCLRPIPSAVSVMTSSRVAPLRPPGVADCGVTEGGHPTVRALRWPYAGRPGDPRRCPCTGCLHRATQGDPETRKGALLEEKRRVPPWAVAADQPVMFCSERRRAGLCASPRPGTLCLGRGGAARRGHMERWCMANRGMGGAGLAPPAPALAAGPPPPWSSHIPVCPLRLARGRRRGDGGWWGGCGGLEGAPRCAGEMTGVGGQCAGREGTPTQATSDAG